jgi:thiol-disulfide isomerase/thioredoxin
MEKIFMFRNYREVIFHLLIFSFLLFCVMPWARADESFVNATPKLGEPTDLKARKTFASALEWERNRAYDLAISDFRKANKQDGGKCFNCMHQAYLLSVKLGAFKESIEIARDWMPAAQNDDQKAMVHYLLGNALLEQCIQSRKQECSAESAQELKTALQLDPKQMLIHYRFGLALARLHQDETARAEFEAFLDQDRKYPNFHLRAERYVENIELARARMAPPFTVTTLDGQRVSMDGLAGKVVLIDFWATWCAPCREALPRIRQIAKRFDGQPLVVLSISLDNDEAKWKDFVAKNDMSWLQYRDGGFTGRIATQFGVNAIPATFTIDADGVLEDQHVGDADIEGKLKKLVAQAASRAAAGKPAESAN